MSTTPTRTTRLLSAIHSRLIEAAAATCIIAGARYEVKELRLGQRIDNDPNTLVLDKGYAVKMGNGGIAITKMMMGSTPESVQLHADELKALKRFI
jgi:hypothetical protein